jgi:hypothetical protein
MLESLKIGFGKCFRNSRHQGSKNPWIPQPMLDDADYASTIPEFHSRVTKTHDPHESQPMEAFVHSPFVRSKREVSG